MKIFLSPKNFSTKKDFFWLKSSETSRKSIFENGHFWRWKGGGAGVSESSNMKIHFFGLKSSET